MTSIVLASSSPYRFKLLSRLGIPFAAEKPKINEDNYKDYQLKPQEYSEKLALIKAKSLLDENLLIIGSDQIASIENNILEKPHNFDNAFKQLSTLSGKTHELYTSVALISSTAQKVWTVKTTLKMHPLSKQQIEKYLELDQPFDCAGSYKIESYGISLFSQINTEDFTAIEGLPLLSLSKELMSLNFPPLSPIR